MISHAKIISSSDRWFSKEQNNIQKLINNNFSSHIYDEQIKLTRRKFKKITYDTWWNKNKDTINLFNRNQIHPANKQDENALRNIIRRYISLNGHNKQLRFIIYYTKV